jgi:hypothetical protein
MDIEKISFEHLNWVLKFGIVGGWMLERLYI